jgi:predicted AAA+ superfamily ATPase
VFPRLLAPHLRRDATYYPVLTLTGPRQSGKTTLARATFPDHAYVSLEAPDQRRFASADPRGFLAQFTGPVILDEIQHTPDLLSYIQVSVDDDGRPGRFVLTGSQHLRVMSQVAQTLAGRTAVLHLVPFSRAEVERQDQPEPVSPEMLFENLATRLDVWQTIRTGFYPRIHDRGVPPEVWLPDYLQTYLERDVRTLTNVGDLALFDRFLTLSAGRVAQLVNYSALATDCGIAVDTARRWHSILQTSFIVFVLKPHHRNFNKRVVRTPKLFFYDTGLLCHLLGIREVSQLVSHPLRGALFENYIVAEVAKSYLHHRLTPPLFFWRDQAGHEIDLLIDTGDHLHAVEIKSGQTIDGDMLSGLRWWIRLAGAPVGRATLVYGGNERHVRDGIAVRPWFSV